MHSTNSSNGLCPCQFLKMYDPNLPLGLACDDASEKGITCCIFHFWPDGKERPIAFGSKTLSRAERNYSQIEKRGLSIVFGVQKFHDYLLRRKFILRTDHRPLTTIFDSATVTIPTRANSRLARWALLLSQYDYVCKV